MSVSRSLFITVSLASAAAALLTVTASAQGPGAESVAPTRPQSAASAAEEEVVVRGRRMSELEFDLPDYVREFIGEVTAPVDGQGYARWDRGVCVGVHNLERTAAQYIVDRVSLLALEVGIEAGEPGCEPDVIIIFTVDAKNVASRMVEENPRLFRPGGGVCCMQLGLEALDDFANNDRPVRWWHVSMPVDERNGLRAIRMPQDDPTRYPVLAVAGPSRIHSGVRDDMHQVIIVVDATKLTGTSWQQLGDYVAVVSLAQIDPNADPTNFDTILNLFSNPGAYSGLTDWDVNYMKALYSLDRARLPELQRNSMASRMVRQERETVGE